jgi:hypothetical protein
MSRHRDSKEADADRYWTSYADETNIRPKRAAGFLASSGNPSAFLSISRPRDFQVLTILLSDACYSSPEGR